MPELPEVETVRRGLRPVMQGARFAGVRANRPDLRFALPSRFAERLVGARLERLGRRGKYLIGELSTDESLIMHLGMSGRFTISRPAVDAAAPEDQITARDAFYYAEDADPRHDHVIFDMALSGGGAARIAYNDPRRFGFMDLAATAELDTCRHFAGMGPEPLADDFSEPYFNAALKARGSAIKTALLDQRLVAGVGNIYACEALYRAGVSPKRQARTVAGVRAARLRAAIREVLEDAIAAGGSSLRDFAGAEGALGYFQHRFDVYDREDAPCGRCGAPIRRLTQGGRSTFYCSRCQR